MKITIFGSGCAGLVTGACMAEVASDVLCTDVDESKIARLQNDELSIYERELERMAK
jgi:UDPglucose 6-dehydrogenase